MRLTIETAKRVIAFIVEPPEPEPESEQSDSQLDSQVERTHPDDVSKRAELDARRPLGFQPKGNR